MHVVSADEKVLGPGEWKGVFENQPILTEAQSHDRLTRTCFSQRPGTARKNRRHMEQAAESGERIDRVERELFSRLLEQGLTLLRAFVDGQGDVDAGPSIKVDDADLRRLRGPRERRYLSVFGGLVIMRRVYGMPEGQ
jgi:hypothetical protein